MCKFDDYYQPCEPGKGLLVNGQYWRSRFGKETLQMMVSDGVFSDGLYNEPTDEQTYAGMEKDHPEDAHALVELLASQIRGLGAEPESLPEDEG